ncbi:SDR family oxidoreductase [Nocardia cyriacigeorgica]|uniref:SDR family NAD(P)-dependent oxidoreductase n=1 Tax=Nocardia cyriacigeorgica TaxID=135487 RepID=UPI001896232E|nr:SDR family oxidoreductase [Nocardia cyriacigeorgica]MBF6317487.1 SDR family oxidoreductase [Nocardia cyriacigeorgica]MBF6345494.1 SDR family oxidoreductase [Nocardia cyriacigeorgica]MBF6514467.1 SDR family oxidoreductase [Nocardia cyriacigeorgica]MBF6531961.1 SDR family oxidoreductase [Nocardia cyriacigeorgica]
MTTPVHLAIGAGPGLGAAVARRFAREGYHDVLTARTDEHAADLAELLIAEGCSAEGAAINLNDADEIGRVVTDVGNRHGRIDLLHFNPSAWREKDPLHLTVTELLEDVTIGIAALLPAVQAAHRFMSRGARILVTGSAAADKPWHGAASLGVQKAGVRNLVTSIDATLATEGIRAVAVQINGLLAETGPFSPPPIAEAMWAAVSRSEEEWTPHVSYDG